MKSYVIALVLLVGVLGGFYGGYKVGQNNVSASANTSTSNRTGGSNAGFGGGFTGGRGAAGVCPSPGAAPGGTALARGTVTDLTSNSLTVTNTSCDVKITFGPTVTISKQVLGSTSDLVDNLTVTITGTRQADGSIKAQTIVIGTAGGGVRIGPGTGSGAGG
jgi:hypothetical protein